MAYRGAIEAVHARCEDLAARLAALEGAPLRKRRAATMRDALELEARLHARFVVLQACRLHDITLNPPMAVAPMIFPAAVAARPPKSRIGLWIVLIACVMAVAAATFALVTYRRLVGASYLNEEPRESVR